MRIIRYGATIAIWIGVVPVLLLTLIMELVGFGLKARFVILRHAVYPLVVITRRLRGRPRWLPIDKSIGVSCPDCAKMPVEPWPADVLWPPEMREYQPISLQAPCAACLERYRRSA
jgi:hypothetical protein